ncbi:hypothetical protein D3C72_783310 [compost metagenome]
MGAGLVRGTVTDDGAAADQGRLAGLGLGGFDGGVDGFRVVTVNGRDDVPAVGFETLGGVVGEPAFHVTVDGDAVVIPERDQFAQLQSTGQGARLVGDTFHQAAVAHEGVGVVVDDVVTRLVELLGHGLLGDRHAHGIGDALTQRASGGLDARGITVLRVTRGARVQLAEVFQIIDGEVVTGEMQQGVQQHGAVAVGQHEAVTVGPLGVVRVVLEVATPQHFGDICHSHGGARVTGVGFLNGIHTQCANGIGKLFTRRHLYLLRLLHLMAKIKARYCPSRAGAVQILSGRIKWLWEHNRFSGPGKRFNPPPPLPPSGWLPPQPWSGRVQPQIVLAITL